MSKSMKLRCKKNLADTESDSDVPPRRSSLKVDFSFESSSPKSSRISDLDSSNDNNKSETEDESSEALKENHSNEINSQNNYDKFNLKQVNFQLIDVCTSNTESISKLKSKILKKTQQLQDSVLLHKTKNILDNSSDISQNETPAEVDISGPSDRSSNTENSFSNTPRFSTSLKSKSLKRRLFDNLSECKSESQGQEIPDTSIEHENAKSPILSSCRKFRREKISRKNKKQNEPLPSSTFLCPETKSQDKVTSMEITTAMGGILKINLDNPESSINSDRTSLNVNTSIDCVEETVEDSSSVRTSLNVNTSIDFVGGNSKELKILPKKMRLMKLNRTDDENNDHLNFKMPQVNSKKNLEKERSKDAESSVETKDVTIVYKTRKRYPSIHTSMAKRGLTLQNVIIDSPSEAESSLQYDSEVIPDSFRESDLDPARKRQKTPKVCLKTPKTSAVNRQKHKLFRQNSGLISLSPVEDEIDRPQPVIFKKKGKKNVKIHRKLKDQSVVSRETTVNTLVESMSSAPNIDLEEKNENKSQETRQHEDESAGSLTSDDEAKVKEKKKTTKAKKKVLSKKIVINKRNRELEKLEELRQEFDSNGSQSSGPSRESTNDFRKEKIIQRNTAMKSSKKLVIVATGFSQEDKELIKSVVKSLGSAEITETVTKYTTHVVSTGVRTVNLLRAIIRGCWLVGMDWVMQSMENQSWIDPAPFEMDHYSKAVKNNRRDRQSFGNSYVPDLFIACGPIYVENGTNPPTRVIKDLIKAAGGEITENLKHAKIVIGIEGLKEAWIMDSITTGKVQSVDDYKRKSSAEKTQRLKKTK